MSVTTRTWRLVVIAMACWLLDPGLTAAEWYVAGQAGVNFADRLKNVQGTGPSSGLLFPDFDLKNSVAYGGKLGVFPGNGAIGIELDAFHSTPHIKALDNAPGIHLGVTNVGLNVLFRYPGPTFQPYAGIGGAALIARLGEAPGTQSDSDVGFGLNLIAGMRALWPRFFGSRLGQIAAVSVGAIIFGFGHLPMGGLAVVITAVLGFCLGLIMVLHRSIWPAVIAHGVFDATTFALLPWLMDFMRDTQKAIGH